VVDQFEALEIISPSLPNEAPEEIEAAKNCIHH
jgi:hypothetical protein